MSIGRRYGWLACLLGAGILPLLAQGQVSFATGPGALLDSVEFLSGDVLRGRWAGWNTNGVRWQHGPEGALLTLRPQGLHKVRLAKSRPLPAPSADTLVQLVNGDQLRGELRELDEQSLLLRTWYAGDLRLHRRELASLQTGLPRFKVLYEGPESLAGWTNQSGVRTEVQVAFGGVFVQSPTPQSLRSLPQGWHYHQGAFYGVNSGFLGRPLDLPPLSSIEFELAWQGSLYLGVWFYTDRIASPDGNGYLLQISSRNVQLARATRTGNNMSLGLAELPDGARRLRLAIRTDLPNKTIAVFANDVLLRQWLDISNLPDLGRGLGFYLAGLSQQVRISHLRVTTWDGQIERPSETPLPAGPHRVRLLNKDCLAGAVKAIRNHTLWVQTDFGELQLPLERVASVELAPLQGAPSTNAPAPPADPWLVRAAFHDGGRLTMRLEHWDAQRVTASGPSFERATFDAALFQSFQFNPSQPRADLDFFDAPGKFPVLPEILLENL